MRQGEEKLHGLSDEVKQNIINEYSSIEECYFRVFYNRHLHYRAFKLNDNSLALQLDNKLIDIEEKLEQLGVPDGHEITTEISSDFSETIAKDFTTKILGTAGATEEDIRQFIASYLE